MKDLKIKICGMRDKENIAQVCLLKPDYLGFIFYPKSRRFVGDNFELSWFKEYELKHGLSLKKVGVFVDAATSYIESVVNKCDLNVLQLHGNETPENCAALSRQFPNIEIWKAFGVDEQFDFQITGSYREYCRRVLFDTRTSQHGGSGQSFNWSLLSSYDKELPVILAGGIGREEIAGLFPLIKNGFPLHAVDINSRAEVSPGIKSVEKLKNIVGEIRGLQ